MKFVAWFPIVSLLAVHTAEAFKDLFRPHPHDKPAAGILDILTKPKIPSISIQLGGGSFGFGFGLGGGQFLPSSGHGVNLPPKETGHGGKPDYHPGDKKDKTGPRPNWGDEEKDKRPHWGDEKDTRPHWGDEKDKRPKPHDDDDYPKPGSYDYDYSKPGGYDDDKDDYTGSLKKDDRDYPKTDDKDSLPDWEDIGEKKSESLMDKDLIGEGLIHPRFNRRRSKRYIESRVFHVPLLFRSNGKPYQVKIRSHPNSLTKGSEKA